LKRKASATFASDHAFFESRHPARDESTIPDEAKYPIVNPIGTKELTI